MDRVVKHADYAVPIFNIQSSADEEMILEDVIGYILPLMFQLLCLAKNLRI